MRSEENSQNGMRNSFLFDADLSIWMNSIFRKRESERRKFLIEVLGYNKMSSELLNFTQKDLPNMTSTDSGVSVAPVLPFGFSLFWADASTVVIIIGVSLGVPGLLGNFLMYKAANFMPKSNNSVFMKYLAIWDSII